jgi:thiol-disulfide isomerase/thioredoxin
MRRFSVFLLLAGSVFFSLGAGTSERDDSGFGKVRMVLFYSGKSEQSMGIIEGILPALQEVYNIEVRLYDVDVPKNYSLFLALGKRYEQVESELPAVFVGEDVIAGESQIWEGLESTIAKYEALGGSDFAVLADIEAEETRTLSQPVYMVYFFQQGCPQCDRVGSLLHRLKKRYDGLVVREIDIDTAEGKILNESISEEVGVTEAKRLTAPSVFFARDALVGDAITTSALERFIGAYEAMEPMNPPWEIAGEKKNRAGARIVERFQRLGLPAVAAAGLIDGVNPCAFATLILFISYLTFVGRGRREILLVGLAFSLSVFVTYFLVGLGLLRIVQSLTVMPLVGRIIYLGAMVLALVFGILSLYDYVLCRRGRSTEMLLQMPAFLKDRVRGIIRKEVKVHRYLVAAGVTGFGVSLLELACTGQVYLPTIIFVAKVRAFRATAVGYLALYNIMFIVPLLAVFAVVYLGIGSERLSILFQRHLSWVKLATSLVFFVLAGALSVSLL